MTSSARNVDLGGGYLSNAPDPPTGVFEIGLVMAGAVSAGAYTAGIIDFLIEALDAWETAKRVRADSNPDPLTWDIPGHSVRLPVASGASAGSMTAAIAAVALHYDFPHIHHGLANANNPFYRSWVQDIDISKLLQTQDMQNPAASVVSMLDSTALSAILRDALDYKAGAAPPRPYLEGGVRFIFTEGNLRGISYFLSLPGNADSSGLGMIAHSDYQSFWVRYSASAPGTHRADDTLVQFPNSSNDAAWTVLGTAALASGAFPIGLAPRSVTRNGANFDYRFVIVPGDGETPAQVCRLRPDWLNQAVPTAYRSVVVDGGTMDNEPLELAREELAGVAGRNPRQGTLASRASILIDPFPDQAGTVDDPSRGQEDAIIPVAMALMGAWKDQARFDPVDLALAADENTYSRFLIGPSRGKSPESNGFALACGALGGFSGFLCQAYRHHDYLLGRRNCQQFLRSHFSLPIDNQSVMSVVNPLLKQPGSPWLTPGDGPPSLPIIPLMGALAQEEQLPPWPKSAYAPESLRGPETRRLDAVLDNVLRNSVHLNWFFRWAAKIGLAKVRSTLVDKSIDIVTAQLRARGLV
jgi:predicted acylesterase/phospholipase RssA